MQDLILGMVQMNAHLGDLNGNLAKVRDYVSKAKALGVDLLCFPEMALTGYCRKRAALLAQEIPGPLSEEISYLAEKNVISIVVGMPEAVSLERPSIAQIVAIPGQNLQVYRKAHLGRSERDFFTPGNSLPVFNSPKVRFAVQICWDLHFPEAVTTLALKGCELVLAPHASPVVAGNRKKIWLKYLPARAYDNSLYLAAVNLVGNDGRQTFSGGTMVLGPQGNVLAENFEGKEALTVVSLKAEALNQIRQNCSSSMKDSFFLAQRRPELYQV